MTDTLFPVVILAGGLATRLRPLTENLPKALVPIHDEPFIAHQLSLLHQQRVKQVVLSLGFLGEKIESYVGDGSRFGLKVSYVYDGDQLLGTAGAIKKALPLLDEHFFILNGDSYLTCDYLAVQNAYLQSQKLALMTLFKNVNQWDKSNVEFKNSTIINYDKIHQTNEMQHIDYGLTVMHCNVFQHVPINTTYDLAVLYQQLLQQNELAAFEVTDRFYEVGSFSGIQALEEYLAVI